MLVGFQPFLEALFLEAVPRESSLSKALLVQMMNRPTCPPGARVSKPRRSTEHNSTRNVAERGSAVVLRVDDERTSALDVTAVTHLTLTRAHVAAPFVLSSPGTHRFFNNSAALAVFLMELAESSTTAARTPDAVTAGRAKSRNSRSASAGHRVASP